MNTSPSKRPQSQSVAMIESTSRREFLSRSSAALVAAATALGFVSVGSSTIALAQSNEVPGGLVIEDVKVGDGAEAVAGMEVKVNYTGWLNSFGGKQFDSSIGRRPLKFRLGSGTVIKGWDSGVQGMRIGGTRRLVIPPELAYGSRSVGNGLIPANSTLYFEVTLLGVSK